MVGDTALVLHIESRSKKAPDNTPGKQQQQGFRLLAVAVAPKIEPKKMYFSF
jgi:hypothetical protein